jgi:uncharacterized lipoprotein
MTIGRWLMCLTFATLSSACSWHKLTHAFTHDCHAPQEYQRAVQVAPLRVPAGLDAPNVQSALVIPAVDVEAPPPGEKEPCLDSPPRFKAAVSGRAPAEPAVTVPPAPPPASDAPAGSPTTTPAPTPSPSPK